MTWCNGGSGHFAHHPRPFCNRRHAWLDTLEHTGTAWTKEASVVAWWRRQGPPAADRRSRGNPRRSTCYGRFNWQCCWVANVVTRRSQRLFLLPGQCRFPKHSTPLASCNVLTLFWGRAVVAAKRVSIFHMLLFVYLTNTTLYKHS